MQIHFFNITHVHSWSRTTSGTLLSNWKSFGTACATVLRTYDELHETWTAISRGIIVHKRRYYNAQLSSPQKRKHARWPKHTHNNKGNSNDNDNVTRTHRWSFFAAQTIVFGQYPGHANSQERGAPTREWAERTAAVCKVWDKRVHAHIPTTQGSAHHLPRLDFSCHWEIDSHLARPNCDTSRQNPIKIAVGVKVSWATVASVCMPGNQASEGPTA